MVNNRSRPKGWFARMSPQKQANLRWYIKVKKQMEADELKYGDAQSVWGGHTVALKKKVKQGYKRGIPNRAPVGSRGRFPKPVYVERSTVMPSNRSPSRRSAATWLYEPAVVVDRKGGKRLESTRKAFGYRYMNDKNFYGLVDDPERLREYVKQEAANRRADRKSREKVRRYARIKETKPRSEYKNDGTVVKRGSYRGLDEHEELVYRRGTYNRNLAIRLPKSATNTSVRNYDRPYRKKKSNAQKRMLKIMYQTDIPQSQSEYYPQVASEDVLGKRHKQASSYDFEREYNQRQYAYLDNRRESDRNASYRYYDASGNRVRDHELQKKNAVSKRKVVVDTMDANVIPYKNSKTYQQKKKVNRRELYANIRVANRERYRLEKDQLDFDFYGRNAAGADRDAKATINRKQYYKGRVQNYVKYKKADVGMTGNYYRGSVADSRVVQSRPYRWTGKTASKGIRGTVVAGKKTLSTVKSGVTGVGKRVSGAGSRIRSIALSEKSHKVLAGETITRRGFGATQEKRMRKRGLLK